MPETDYPTSDGNTVPVYPPDPNWTPELNAALAKAQGEMRAASKDAKNPHFGSRYADMASVVEACRPLATHGLAFVQFASVNGAIVTVTTTLRHASGQTLDCGTLTARSRDEGPQNIGSTLTYLRRYGLQCAVGIGSADDDGNAGQGRETPAASPVAPAPTSFVPPGQVQLHDGTGKPVGTVTVPGDEADPSFAKDRRKFFAALADLGVTKLEADAIAEDMGAPRPSRLPQDRRDRFLAYLSTPTGRDALATYRDAHPQPETT